MGLFAHELRVQFSSVNGSRRRPNVQFAPPRRRRDKTIEFLRVGRQTDRQRHDTAYTVRIYLLTVVLLVCVASRPVIG